jgi:tetratricopeptide (TPR) repeat protein
MHIDENMIRPCANIGDISQFEYEEEVLFSLGSVWKIESVQCLSTFWEVVLYSCSKTDSQLAEVKHCLIHGPTLLSLGDILRKQGDLAKAERFYNRMLKDGSLSEKIKGFLYHGLGLTYLERDQVGDAVKYLEMAVPLIENQSDENIGILPPFYLYTPDDRPSRVKILNNIGLMYQNIGEYDKARQWYFKGLEKPDETKSQLDRAAIYYNLGRLTYNQGLYREAYNYYQEAVRLANGYPINDKFQKVLSILETYLTEQCRQNCANDDSATDTDICAAYSHIVPTS